MSAKRTIDDFFKCPIPTPPPKRGRTSSPRPSVTGSGSAQDHDDVDPELALAMALSLKTSQPQPPPSTNQDQSDGVYRPDTPRNQQQGPTFTHHPSYPHPIAKLPSLIISSLRDLPARPPTALRPPVASYHEDLDSLFYHPLIPRAVSITLFQFLRKELPFYRVSYDINRFGKSTKINTPRYTTVFGVDDSCRFTEAPSAADLADLTLDQVQTLVSADDARTPVSPHSYQRPPRPIPGCLLPLKDAVECVTNERYNFVLVNYYANGNDSISYHSDDERFLGELPAIASLSLGAVRDFCMKHKDESPRSERQHEAKKTKPGEGVIKIPLESGDMVLMRGPTQSNWLHAVPKRKGDMGRMGRINITFRRAMAREGTNNYYRYNVGDGAAWRWDESKMTMVEWGKTYGT